MARSKTLSALLGMLALSACAAVPPAGPTVVALPPQGKALTQFQQEDASCRQYASTAVGYGAQANPAGNTAPDAKPINVTTSQLQIRYNIAYTQCMASSGNQMQAFPAGYASYGLYGAAYADAAYYGPWYDPWYGPFVGVDFVGGFGPRFHRGGFIHHGGGFAHGGFAHGGGHGR